ncbi:hypothetical protein [Roseibium sp.]|uniref:hypothetical protein n=1 Tax=Roseibium sp. TaxID=1936156 RepID=UPI003D0A7E9D
MDESSARTETQTSKALGAERELSVYMMLVDDWLNIFSVFDDLRYDRSDADIMSPGMRTHAVQQLKPFGFKQTSGSVLHNKADDVFCYIPKPQVLGASPFDVLRYTPKRERDYYILTPTQTACQIIDTYSFDDALEKVSALIQKQPINLYRLMDYLERKPVHETIREALGHFKFIQRKAVQSEPLKRRKALGSGFFG